MKKRTDYHAEYLVRAFKDYARLSSFNAVYGGCYISRERWTRAERELKNKKSRISD